METHLPPLAAETIFSIGALPITNSFITAVIVSAAAILVAVLATRRLTLVPHGLQNLLEIILEQVLEFMDLVTQDRRRSEQFLPIIGTLFLFIMTSNLLGVFPGIGSIGRYVTVHGEREFFPLFRSANTDYNLTLAMALAAVITSHVFGIMAIGFWKYADRFVRLGTLWHSLRKGGMSIVIAVIELGVGFIEIISEIAKVASLSLRLFGNVFAGEVLLTVIGGLIPVFVPLPFLLMETIVGVIQATVFAMLTLVYLTMATSEHGEHESPATNGHS